LSKQQKLLAADQTPWTEISWKLATSREVFMREY